MNNEDGLDAPGEALVREWTSWLEAQQAEDVRSLDLRSVSDLCDFFVVASARNRRHLEHLCNEAMRMAKSRSLHLGHGDGLDGSGWVVLDFGDIMIHLFLPDLRAHFDLEGFWRERIGARDSSGT